MPIQSFAWFHINFLLHMSGAVTYLTLRRRLLAENLTFLHKLHNSMTKLQLQLLDMDPSQKCTEMCTYVCVCNVSFYFVQQELTRPTYLYARLTWDLMTFYRQSLRNMHLWSTSCQTARYPGLKSDLSLWKTIRE